MSFPAVMMNDTTQKFKGHTRRVTGVIHLPGVQQFITCSGDGFLGRWNLQTGQMKISRGRVGAIRAIALSVDGKKVVGGSYDGVVRLWSVESGTIIAEWTGHTHVVTSVCWNGDGERVLSGSSDGTARVWDAETGNTILTINTGLNYVYTAVFSPDSTLIATGGDSSNERIEIYTDTLDVAWASLKGHTEAVYCLAWTLNGKTLISGSYDDTIRTWNTSTWQQLAVFRGHSSTVEDIAISPNGRILASASWDNTARLWNLQNGQPIASPLQHPSCVNCVSFSADGTLLATGCDDANAYTWDISAITEVADLNELLDDENLGKSSQDDKKSSHDDRKSSQDDTKSFLDADATPDPVQDPENANQLPEGFFAETPQHPDPATTSPPSKSHDSDAPPEIEPSSPERTQRHFFKWPHRNRPAQPAFQQTQLHFFTRSQRHENEATVELQERAPSITDVPLATANLRNVSKWDIINKKKREAAAKKKRKQEKEAKKKNDNDERARQAKIAKVSTNAATSSQLPTQSNITQPAAGPSQTNPNSSEPQATTFTSPISPTPPAATTSSTPLPDAVLLQAGCWTRFSLCIGCVSRYPGDHH